MTVINYIIPIKKPELIGDKDGFRKLLGRTLASIGRQAGEKKVYIAAGAGTPLPELPEFAEVIEVGDTGVDTGTAESRGDFYKLVRKDKGMRVRAAMDRITHHKALVMVVDDDDLLHHGLARFIIDAGQSFYLITKGFMHNVGSGAFYRMDNFHQSCGTSVIVHRGLYRYRPTMAEALIDQAVSELGSHVMLPERLMKRAWPMTEVPFRAAVYCTGNQNATQRTIRERFGRGGTAEHSRAVDDLLVSDEERAGIREAFGI